jgi:hypothetical protein
MGESGKVNFFLILTLNNLLKVFKFACCQLMLGQGGNLLARIDDWHCD